MSDDGKKSAQEVVDALITNLRMIAGRSGTEEFLEALRELDVYAIEPLIELPLPMFFDAAWTDLIERLLKEAQRA